MRTRYFFATHPETEHSYLLALVKDLNIYVYSYIDDRFYLSEEFIYDFWYEHDYAYMAVAEAHSIQFLIDIEYGKDSPNKTGPQSLSSQEVFDG